jgi:ubiquinone/menaquinone biosynthesis C-methylase UbiE
MRANYDDIADTYDDDAIRGKEVDPHLVDFLIEHQSHINTLRTLDLACGTGNQQVANKERFPDIEMWGADKFPKMLARAKTKSELIRWVQADMEDPDLNLGIFDFISCQFAYHHVQDKEVLFSNVRRHLSTHGWFALVNLNVFNMEDWVVYQFFPAARTLDERDFLTTDALVELGRRANLEVVRQKSDRFAEIYTIDEAKRRYSNRHAFSQLLGISDVAFDEGIRALEDKKRQQPSALVSSSVSLTHIVFRAI